MNHDLIPSFLMRLTGLIVNEYPQLLTKKPTKSHHMIFDQSSKIRINLAIKWIILHIPTCLPTASEPNEYINIHVSLDSQTWDTNDKTCT